MKHHKRLFGYFEIVFDLFYLCAVLVLGGCSLLYAKTEPQRLAGVMALVLAGGDAFHLLPRVAAVRSGKEARLDRALGFGKLITSMTMTVFYLLLWQLGVLLFSPGPAAWWSGFVYALAAARVLLCLLPQNRWADRRPPVRWGVYRNLPFFLLGAMVAALFWLNRADFPALYWMWLAIAMSFAFYLPVVLWVNRLPMLGMLMFPKTCAYLWIILMCLSL